MDILLANPRGFCAGVDRAIEIVKRAIESLGAPIYVRHEVVHNRFVVEDLKQRGAVFVEELDEVPEGGTVIFSAHGVSQSVRADAAARGLRVFDATCPLVTKVHIEVARHCRAGRDVIATLRQRFPALQGPRHDDICYATQNRQVAVKAMAPHCDLVLVVGSQNSSNSKRLVEVALTAGAGASYLIDFAKEIDDSWLDGVETVGVTSGASVPELLVQGVVIGLFG